MSRKGPLGVSEPPVLPRRHFPSYFAMGVEDFQPALATMTVTE